MSTAKPESERLLTGLARKAKVSAVETAGGCIASKAMMTMMVKTIATPAAK